MQNKRKATGPKGPAALFLRIQKFHQECMMGFAKNVWPGVLALTAAAFTAGTPAMAQQPQKPNILVIMGDDIGYWKISAYNHRIMG